MSIPADPGVSAAFGGVGVEGGRSLALLPGCRAAVKPLVPSGPRAILTAWLPFVLAMP